MRLVTYRLAASWQAGIVVGDVVVSAAVAGRSAAFAGLNDHGCARVRDVIALDAADRAAVVAAAEALASDGLQQGVVPLAEARLGPPVPDPDKIICVGLNYHEHAAETELEPPAAPVLFPKYRNSLIGSGDAIELPAVTDAPDYEGELAIVIGRRAKDVPASDALAFVAGMMPFNDVSARDLQMRTSQWLAGKALDTFAPCGPQLVTLDEIPDVQDLALVTRLNGEVVQQATTAAMIFPVAETVAYVSALMTLEPGDIIATGTPAGVGYTREPPVRLRPGDVVEVEIERVGHLINPVVAAGRPAADASDHVVSRI